jgi:hypothetical protein
VTTVLCETPTVIEGHAFTTGKIKRASIEKVLPNTFVEFKIQDGLGCDATHYTPAELQGKIVPDEHIHEHATCFNVKDKGLVVIGSCGHVGIVNSVRQAQDVSGIQKVHAIVGGFHLGPAPKDYLDKVVAEIKKLEPDVVASQEMDQALDTGSSTARADPACQCPTFPEKSRVRRESPARNPHRARQALFSLSAPAGIRTARLLALSTGGC